MHSTTEKIFTWPQLNAELTIWRLKDDVIVFTNGCFDLLHRGHVDYLEKAKALGTRLVVGINSDASPWFMSKGPGRPLVEQDSRTHIIAALQSVDAVVLFDEETPEELIRLVQPNILVKASDYQGKTIAGSDFVKSKGGRVELIDVIPGISTTALIEKIRKG